MVGVWLIGVASGLPSAIVFRVLSVPLNGDGRTTKPYCTATFPRVGGVDSGHAYRLLLHTATLIGLLIISSVPVLIQPRQSTVGKLGEGFSRP